MLHRENILHILVAQVDYYSPRWSVFVNARFEV